SHFSGAALLLEEYGQLERDERGVERDVPSEELPAHSFEGGFGLGRLAEARLDPSGKPAEPHQPEPAPKPHGQLAHLVKFLRSGGVPPQMAEDHKGVVSRNQVQAWLAVGVNEREQLSQRRERLREISLIFEGLGLIDQKVLSLTAAVDGEGSFEEIESLGKLALVTAQRGFHTEDSCLVEEPLRVPGLAGLPESLGPLEFVLGLGSQ